MAKARKKPDTNGYSPRLKDRFDEEVRARLQEEFGYSTAMRVPRIEKITLNMGVGDAKINARALDKADRRRLLDFVATLERQERAADLGPLLAK